MDIGDIDVAGAHHGAGIPDRADVGEVEHAEGDRADGEDDAEALGVAEDLLFEGFAERIEIDGT